MVLRETSSYHETHISLFNANIMILEGLMLRNVEEGNIFFMRAPILIPGAEAAPVRAYLIK